MDMDMLKTISPSWESCLCVAVRCGYKIAYLLHLELMEGRNCRRKG